MWTQSSSLRGVAGSGPHPDLRNGAPLCLNMNRGPSWLLGGEVNNRHSTIIINIIGNKGVHQRIVSL